MKPLFATLLVAAITASTAFAGISVGGRSTSVNRYHPNSLSNPYGAGNPYRANGMMNPYNPYGSRYSNQSWRNPYATQAPRIYDNGQYRGRMSTNRYAPDSTSHPYGRYGNPYSVDSINNPYGAGNPYQTRPMYVYPVR